MRKRTAATLSAVAAFGALGLIGIIVATAYAYSNHNVGGDVKLKGYNNNVVYIDLDGDGNLDDEAFYFQQVSKAGVFSGGGTVVDASIHLWEGRAEAAVGLMEGTGEDADAWIQSSGNARVRCEADGDVVITLGS